MDINKVFLTGTVSSVSYKSLSDSFKLKFSIKTEEMNSKAQGKCGNNVTSFYDSKNSPEDTSLYADYHEVYLFRRNDEREQKRLAEIVRCGNRVSVSGQLRNFRITDSLGKIALTSRVVAYEIKSGT